MSTSKISVTIDASELTWLRRRAKQIHGGNLSAAVVEATRTLRKQEALRAFLEKEGVPHLDANELAAVQDEWRPPTRSMRHTKKRSAR
jgi:hypothetical protein